MATRRSSAATTDDEDDVFIYAMVCTEVPTSATRVLLIPPPAGEDYLVMCISTLRRILVEVELSEALS